MWINVKLSTSIVFIILFHFFIFFYSYSYTLNCSVFWGICKINKRDPCELLPKENVVDPIYMKFLRQMLGVQHQTHKIGTHLEEGRVQLMTYVQKNYIKNWYRIAMGIECNPLTHLSSKNILENEFEWYKKIESYMNHLR